MSGIVAVTTWSDGVFLLDGDDVRSELAGESVRAPTSDGAGGMLAIVGGHRLHHRDSAAAWTTLFESEHELSAVLPVRDGFFVGTDGDARLLRIDAAGECAFVDGFDRVVGRETWFAGAAVVDGRVMGPPLGVRTMSVTAGGALLANVHVGGIPRSEDGGATWQPTIDVKSDVHEVRAHPHDPDIVVAAAAVGLCTSGDGGSTWKIEADGLHAPYCSAVTLAGEDIYVAASEDHFAPRGAIYRRPVAGGTPSPIGAGFPEWTEGIVDTDCLAANGSALAAVDKAGNLYVSRDAGVGWSRCATDLPAPSGVLVF